MRPSAVTRAPARSRNGLGECGQHNFRGVATLAENVVQGAPRPAILRIPRQQPLVNNYGRDRASALL